MVTLTTESTKGPKTYYAEALLRVGGVSQYNDDQLRFDGLDGYWSMTEWAMKNTNGKIPPVGAIAWFKLATNPKKGGNAKPGSMYQDIMGIRRATPEELEAFAPPAPQEPSEHYLPPFATPQPQQTGSGAPQDPLAQRILLGMAFNNLTVWLAHIPPESAAPEYMIALWDKWFTEASQGLPLTPANLEPPVEPPDPPTDDSPLVQAAKDMGATEQFTEPEALPW